MRFVRPLSDALKFRPWLRFWSLVCISSGCGRFVALWGSWSFVRWFFGFSVAVDRRQLFGWCSGVVCLLSFGYNLPVVFWRPFWILCGFFCFHGSIIPAPLSLSVFVLRAGWLLLWQLLKIRFYLAFIWFCGCLFGCDALRRSWRLLCVYLGMRKKPAPAVVPLRAFVYAAFSLISCFTSCGSPAGILSAVKSLKLIL